MKINVTSITVLICIFIGGMVWSQTVTGPPPGETTAHYLDQTRDNYIIGPRDKVEVSVWGEHDMKELVDVSFEGTIPFFFLGEIKIGGLTVGQAREKLNALLADGYFKNPVVTIQIHTYKSKEVQIQGAVQKPGTYALQSNYITLFKLISMAGGTSPSRGNFAYIYRGGAAKISKVKTGANEDPSKNNGPTSEDGSTSKPPKKDTPADNEIPLLLREEERIVVDLRLLIDQGDRSQDVIIHPGDLVLIGTFKSENISVNYIWVEGAVRTPKQIEYHEGMTALQACIQAGGLSEVSAPNRTIVNRIGPDGTYQTIRVRLKDIQKGKRPKFPLQPGDRITVRESIF